MKVSKTSAYALHALMYMVRHTTQLPATTNIIAKAEGIPAGYLAKIFPKLVKAGFVKTVKGKNKGYIFAKSPEEISLLELLEVIDGQSLFDDCLLRHCECEGTPENCCIFAKWMNATKKSSGCLQKLLWLPQAGTIRNIAFTACLNRLKWLTRNQKPKQQDQRRKSRSHILRNQKSQSVSLWTAVIVLSKSFCLCSVETKQASNCDGGR